MNRAVWLAVLGTATALVLPGLLYLRMERAAAGATFTGDWAHTATAWTSRALSLGETPVPGAGVSLGALAGGLLLVPALAILLRVLWSPRRSLPRTGLSVDPTKRQAQVARKTPSHAAPLSPVPEAAPVPPPMSPSAEVAPVELAAPPSPLPVLARRFPAVVRLAREGMSAAGIARSEGLAQDAVRCVLRAQG